MEKAADHKKDSTNAAASTASSTALVRRYLSPGEIAALQMRSTWRAARLLLGNWAIIFLAFALAGFANTPLASFWVQIPCLLLALMLLAGRQMALAVIMHETIHNSFFKTRRLNTHLGAWFAAAPMGFYAEGYSQVHMHHHRLGGTPDDPDAALVRGYPTRPATMARKIFRDLTGIVGFRTLLQGLRVLPASGWARFLSVHALLATILWLAGIGWSYLLWWGAFFFVFPFIYRLRLIGEHGTAINRLHPDVRQYTTTVCAGLLARLFIAPNGVHYHIEHHLLPSVPIYRLHQLHALLQQRGFFNGTDCLRTSYLDVLRRAVLGKGAAPPILA